MSGMQLAHDGAGTSGAIFSTGEWQVWFAWRPVRLLMTRRYAWLRHVHRRCVNKAGFETCEYTDEPEVHPAPDLVLKHFS